MLSVTKASQKKLFHIIKAMEKNHARLQIFCFGGLKVILDGEEVTSFSTDKARALLIYLALDPGRPFQRSHLAGLLWSDQSDTQALHSLRQTLSLLRKSIFENEPGNPFLIVERDRVKFNSHTSFWVDVLEFKRELQAAYQNHRNQITYTSIDLRSLKNAIGRYTGPFLDRFTLNCSALFDEWLILVQEETNTLAVEALSYLVDYHQKRGEIIPAIQFCKQILQINPWDESIHYRLMNLMAIDGQWTAAQNAYKNLHTYLKIQIGVEPDPKTKALFQKIRSSSLNSQSLPNPYPSPASNLPNKHSIFIGRDKELDEISALLASTATHLLTLSGAGGIGKTRIALEVAAQQIGIYKDGVFFASLLNDTTLVQVETSIAQAVGLPFSDQLQQKALLLDFLRLREIFLILDNCDQLASNYEFTEFISEIIRTAKNLKMLITSRERLNIQEEHVFIVEGLPYPGERPNTRKELNLYDSLELFQTRVQQSNRFFKINEKNQHPILHLCQLMEGHPLAIELAASSISAQVNADLLARVDEEIDTFIDAYSNATPQHRSLKTVFDVSWKLLSKAQQKVLAKLSIFRGGFELSDAENLTTIGSPIFSQLINKSLLRQQDGDRCDMHEIIRRFSQEKLEESGDYPTMRSQHAYYFQQQLSQQSSVLIGEKQNEVLDWIEREFENIKAAWNWLLSVNEFKKLENMIEILYQFFNIRSWFLEGIGLFQDTQKSLQLNSDNSIFLGMVFARIAALAYRARMNDLVSEAITQSMNIFEFEKNESEIAFCLVTLGGLHLRKKSYQEALTCSQKSLQLYTQNGNISGQSYSAYLQGLVYNRMGNYPLSKTALEQSLALSIKVNDQRRCIAPLNVLGDLACLEGDYPQAEVYFQQGIEIARALKDRFNLAILLNNLATIYQIYQQFSQEKKALEESISISHEIGDLDGEALALNNLGEMAIIQEDFSQAIEYSKKALTIANQIGEEFTIISCHNSLAEAYLGLGNFQQAAYYFKKSISLALEIDSLELLTRISVNAAPIFLNTENEAAAIRLVKTAINHPAIDNEFLQKGKRLLEVRNIDCRPTPETITLQAIVRELFYQ